MFASSWFPVSRAVLVAAAVTTGGCPASVEREVEPAGSQPGGPWAVDGGRDPGGNQPAGLPGLVLPDAGVGPAVAPEPGTCASQVHTAQRAAVDLLLLVDTSDSMNQLSGTQAKWELVRQALRSFVEEPASAGLGVGLQFFPSGRPVEQLACQEDSDCAGVSEPVARACSRRGFCFAPGHPLLTNRPCAPGLVSPFNCPAGLECKPQGTCPQSAAPCVSGSPCPGGPGELCQVTPGRCSIRGGGCDESAYRQLDVAIGELPGHAVAVAAALAAREPDGSTPLAVAARSALTLLAARAASHPERRAALVLATDGLPTACGQEAAADAAAARIEQARTAPPSIPSYIVGVFATAEVPAARPTLERLASAGGTGSPFILTPGNDLGQQLLQALQEIRGQAVACEYNLPQPAAGPIDYARVNVRTRSQGRVEDLAQVSGPDRCPPDRGGWHYDRPPAPGAPPSRLVVCPATCARLRADTTAQVDLLFGCATRRID